MNKEKTKLTIQEILDCYKERGEAGNAFLESIEYGESDSFEISERGSNEYWRDTNTGCEGDVIDFVGKCEGYHDKNEAAIRCNEIIRQLSGDVEDAQNVSEERAECSIDAEVSEDADGQENEIHANQSGQLGGQSPEVGDIPEVADVEPAESLNNEEPGISEDGDDVSELVESGEGEQLSRVSDQIVPGGDGQFPLSVLPPKLASFINSVAANAQVPVENVVVWVLGLLSVSLGKGARLEDGTGLSTYPNVYMIISQESGSGKSRVSRIVCLPMLEFQQELQGKWERETRHIVSAELKRLEFLKKAAEQKLKSVTDDKTSDVIKELAKICSKIDKLQPQLLPPVIFVEEITPEIYEKLLVQFNGNVAIVGSDARSVGDSMMGNKQARHLIYIKGFDGEALNSHRSSNPTECLAAPEPVLQIVISMQPDKLQQLYGCSDAYKSGLLGRILIAGRPFEGTKLQSIPIPGELLEWWGGIVKSLLAKYRMCEVDPEVFKIGEDAFQVLNEMAQEIDAKIEDCTYKHVQSSARRRIEYVRKFAIILHVLKNPESPSPLIELATVQEAMEIESWFFNNLLEFRSFAVREEELQEEGKIISYLGNYPDGASRSQIRRDCRLPNANAAKFAMERLVAAGKVKYWDIKPEGGGTRSHMYKVAS